MGAHFRNRVERLLRFFGVIGIPIALLMPFDQLSNAPGTPPGFLSWFRTVLFIIYGVPLTIGIWWLILFNRKSTKSIFAGEASPSTLAVDEKPRCPIAITVLAWFFIVSAANLVIYPFFPIRMPLILFGHIFPGVSMTSFFIPSCLLLLVAGIGILKLQRWSYSFTIGLQLFFVTNGLLTLLTPNFERMMADVVKQTNNTMHLSGDSLGAPNFISFLRLGMYGGLLFSAAILVLLFYYRERFLQAAEARKLQQSPRVS